MTNRRIWILGMLIPLSLSSCAQRNPAQHNQPPQTAASVDLKQYMGTWYEIASFPNYFQRKCQCTTANYQLKGNYVRIYNRCIKQDSKRVSSATGKGWPVAGSRNTKLKVQFFWPFKADYWILYHSPNYQSALVGSPSRKYLWVLSRQPTINQSEYKKIISIAQAQGYSITRLNKTVQHCR